MPHTTVNWPIQNTSLALAAEVEASVAAAVAAGAKVTTVDDSVYLDFDSDKPLVCSRDQSGDKTCESCQ